MTLHQFQDPMADKSGDPNSSSAIGRHRGQVGRLASLDGWRAVAIILVLMSHLWATSGVPDLGPVWARLSHHGNLGVRIFFGLSGFLITYLLLIEHDRTGKIDLKAFYIRRIFRIFPVYFLYLFVLIVSQTTGIYYDHLSTWFGAFTFTRNVIGQGDSATGHLWSLAVEEQFYLVWPVTLAAAALHTRRSVAFGMLAVAMLVCFFSRLIHCESGGFVCRYVFHVNSALRYGDCLAAGCIAAFVRARFIQPPKAALFMATGATIALIASSQLGFDHQPIAASLLVSCQSILTAIALLGSVDMKGGLLHTVLNFRIVAFLGTISYSLYIWHMMFLRAYVGPRFPLGQFAQWNVWWIGALAFAVASYYLFERYFVAKGKVWRR